MNAIQIVSFVGSLIGTATAVFVLFDRFFRYRPLAFMVVKGTEHNAHRYVRVKNIGMADVIIMDITASPPSFEIATGHSVREIADAIVDKPAISILQPGAEADFPIFANPKKAGEKDYAGKIRFAVRWRKASSTWLPQLPAFVLTSTYDLRRMEQAL